MRKLIALVSLLCFLSGCAHKENYRSILYEGEINLPEEKNNRIYVINYDKVGHRFIHEGFKIQDEEGNIAVIEDNNESEIIGDYPGDVHTMIIKGTKKEIPPKRATQLVKEIRSEIEDKVRTDFDTLV